jgi:hypothetical protein
MAFGSMALETLPISFLVDKALLDAMLYLVFFFFLVISVDSTYYFVKHVAAVKCFESSRSIAGQFGVFLPSITPS